MKTFTIDAENNITLHPSRKAARDTGAGVFATEEQFADLIGPDNKRLVEIWNSLSGVKPVTKFANRKVATERIWKAIQGLGEAPAAAPAAEPQPASAEAGAAPAELPVAESARPQEDAILQGEIEPSALKDAGASGIVEPAANVGAPAPQGAPAKAKATRKTTPVQKAAAAAKGAKKAKAEGGAREGSKTAAVVALLERKGGATLAEIMKATGWQAHSVSGFISGTLGKKMGRTVESTKREDGERLYQLKG